VAGLAFTRRNISSGHSCHPLNSRWSAFPRHGATDLLPWVTPLVFCRSHSLLDSFNGNHLANHLLRYTTENSLSIPRLPYTDSDCCYDAADNCQENPQPIPAGEIAVLVTLTDSGMHVNRCLINRFLYYWVRHDYWHFLSFFRFGL
jgi:hypothetical protein